MAKYELEIYKNGEVEKTVTAKFCPWGVFASAAEIQERAADHDPAALIGEMENIILQVFDGLTREELRRADSVQVMNVFARVANGNANGGSKAIKNA